MATHQPLGNSLVSDRGPRGAQGPSPAPDGDAIPWVNSIFEQPWWLDAVAPGQWGAAEVRRDGAVLARLPYMLRRKLGVTAIVQPKLTPTLGPWLAPMEGKYARHLEVQKKLLGQLVDLLPSFDFFRQNFDPTLTNCLPFYWAGFEASIRYTYRIEDLSDLDRVRGEFQEQVRRGIRKAQKTVEIDSDFPLDELLRLNTRTFKRQGLWVPYSDDFVRRLDAACAGRGARRILGAVDARGHVHAALYVVWDERTLYPIINARDPEVQAFGSNTLLYWEAIRLASEVSRTFDFEGSMLEPVEHFVRAFGGRQTPYLSLSKAGLKGRSAAAAVRSVEHVRGKVIRRRAAGAAGSPRPERERQAGALAAPPSGGARPTNGL